MAVSGTFYGTTANSMIIPKIIWGANQSFADNTSTVTATLYYSRENAEGDNTAGYWEGTLTINGDTKSVSSQRISISYQSNSLAIQHTVVVPHEKNGTKTITISATGKISGTSLSSTTISSTITLDPFNRVSTFTAGNGTLGESVILTVDKASDNFTHTIKYKCGSVNDYICTKSSSTTIRWIPPIELASENVSSTKVSVTLTMTTFDGGSTTGTYQKTISLAMPDSIKPSCSPVVSDAEGLEETYGGFIKGVSKFAVSIKTGLAYDSPIVSYKTVANGATYTAQSFTTDVLKASGTQSVKTTVTDKRGRSATSTRTYTVLAYNPPQISKLTMRRCLEDGTDDGQGEYVKVTFSAVVTDVSNLNTAAYKIQYKKSSASSYTTVSLSDYANQLTVTDGEYIFAADSDSTYDVVLTVTDNFKTVSRSTNASSAYTMMHWLATGMGMAIGKVAELVNTLDIGFRTRHYGGILHPVLVKSTDLDTVIVPNVYASLGVSSSGYSNCPVTSGYFVLEVTTAGANEDVILQRLTSVHKTSPKTYKRVYQSGSWGSWIDELASVSGGTTASSTTYADGYVLLTVGSLPTQGTESFTVSLPSGVTDYWIESAWAIADNIRYQFPICDVDNGVQMTACLTTSGSTVKVKVNGWLSENYDLTHKGYFVISYKL